MGAGAPLPCSLEVSGLDVEGTCTAEMHVCLIPRPSSIPRGGPPPAGADGQWADPCHLGRFQVMGAAEAATHQPSQGRRPRPPPSLPSSFPDK